MRFTQVEFVTEMEAWNNKLLFASPASWHLLTVEVAER